MSGIGLSESGKVCRGVSVSHQCRREKINGWPAVPSPRGESPKKTRGLNSILQSYLNKRRLGDIMGLWRAPPGALRRLSRLPKQAEYPLARVGWQRGRRAETTHIVHTYVPAARAQPQQKLCNSVSCAVAFAIRDLVGNTSTSIIRVFLCRRRGILLRCRQR